MLIASRWTFRRRGLTRNGDHCLTCRGAHPLRTPFRARAVQRQVLEALECAIGASGDALGESTLVMMRPLHQSTLRSFTFPTEVDRLIAGRAVMVVLCHFAEGRTLLTDADGLYNTFLVAASRISRGNVFIALTNIPMDDEEDDGGGVEEAAVPSTPVPAARLADRAAVDDLAQMGGQRSVDELYRRGRFLTWEELPSRAQLRHLHRALAHQVPPLPELPVGILGNARRDVPQKRSFCPLL